MTNKSHKKSLLFHIFSYKVLIFWLGSEF